MIFIPIVMKLDSLSSHSPEYDSPIDVGVNAIALISAIYIMSVVCGFKWTTAEFIVHTDIAVLHFLGMVHTVLELWS